MYFFTVVTEGRAPILCTDAALSALRSATRDCQAAHPFEVVATVLLPDHLHAIWRLPENDSDFAIRWRSIKSAFTHGWLAAGGAEQPRSASRQRHRRRGVWQRKFWEHHIRDDADYAKHLDYIHYNPVKHAHAACPHAWPWSTFNKWVRRSVHEPTWCCACEGRTATRPDLGGLEEAGME
jgi:putative transposase